MPDTGHINWKRTGAIVGGILALGVISNAASDEISLDWDDDDETHVSRVEIASDGSFDAEFEAGLEAYEAQLETLADEMNDLSDRLEDAESEEERRAVEAEMNAVGEQMARVGVSAAGDRIRSAISID